MILPLKYVELMFERQSRFFGLEVAKKHFIDVRTARNRTRRWPGKSLSAIYTDSWSLDMPQAWEML